MTSVRLSPFRSASEKNGRGAPSWCDFEGLESASAAAKGDVKPIGGCTDDVRIAVAIEISDLKTRCAKRNARLQLKGVGCASASFVSTAAETVRTTENVVGVKVAGIEALIHLAWHSTSGGTIDKEVAVLFFVENLVSAFFGLDLIRAQSKLR